jgi:hypothetical protein
MNLAVARPQNADLYSSSSKTYISVYIRLTLLLRNIVRCNTRNFQIKITIVHKLH